jgi:hypothetical protein
VHVLLWLIPVVICGHGAISALRAGNIWAFFDSIVGLLQALIEHHP